MYEDTFTWEAKWLRLVFCEIDQNEVSLRLKQEQLSANRIRKINLIQSENKFSYTFGRF